MTPHEVEIDAFMAIIASDRVIKNHQNLKKKAPQEMRGFF
jgi:aromatic ring-opening dioxygenase LigB subunit